MRTFLIALFLSAVTIVPQAIASHAVTHSTYPLMTGMQGMMMMPWQQFPNVATDQNAETMVSGPMTHGFYVAPEAKYARIDGNDSALIGGRAALLINHRFAIGGAGYMMANRIPAPPENQAKSTYRRYYSLGYGGLLLGYVFAPQKLVHVEANVIVGGGSFGAMHSGSGMMGSRYGGASNLDYLEPARFFIVEPDVHLEINVAPLVRLAVGGGYRIVTGLNEIGFENKAVRGPSGSVLLKLGIL